MATRINHSSLEKVKTVFGTFTEYYWMGDIKITYDNQNKPSIFGESKELGAV